MQTIKIPANKLESGLKQMVESTRNEFKSYLWLGKAQTIFLSPMFANPGFVITLLMEQKMKEWKR